MIDFSQLKKSICFLLVQKGFFLNWAVEKEIIVFPPNNVKESPDNIPKYHPGRHEKDYSIEQILFFPKPMINSVKFLNCN